MSKYVNGGTRSKTARETYVEQLSYGRGLTPWMNKKRETFTSLDPSDNTDFAYRSTPNYLRQLTQQGSSSSTDMISARNIPRTKSASELTPRNNLNRSMTGNPKYKAQEDYYDEIQSLKKDMKTVKEENSNLRAKIRRLEEDNARKRKEIDALYDTSKDGDLRRALPTDRNNNNSNTANVVMSLKQRLFKLEQQLKQKENQLDEIKSDPRWTKSTELEIQNRALFGELERQKVERLNDIQNDYMASVDEEKKNAVRQLNREKDELKKENESLKRKIQELEDNKHTDQLSARTSDSKNDDRDLLKKTENFKQMKHELDQLHDKFEEMKRARDEYRKKYEKINDNFEEIKEERNQYRKKFEQTNENLEEIKRERDQYKKRFEQINDNLDREKQIKPTQTGRSSPVLKRHEEQHQNPMNISSTSIKRPQSPPVGDKRTPRSSAVNIRRDPDIFEEPIKVESKSSYASPSLTSKFDNFGSGTLKNRPSSPSTSNEPALKTVQASLRGHLNRSEIDKTPSQLSSRTGSKTALKENEPIESDREDDIVIKSSKKPLSQYESGKKQDSFLDQPKSNSEKTLPNNKMGSNNRDLSSKPRRTPSPPADNQRPSSPRVGAVSGSKQNLPNDRSKLGSENRFSARDKDSTSKLRRTPSPPADNQRPSSPRVGAVSSSKQNLPNDRSKLGSENRFSARDKDSTSKLRRTPSPPADNQRPSSPRVGAVSGSKQNLPNDRSSDNRLLPRDKDSASKLRRTPSPPADNQRPSSPHVGASSGSKQNLPNDRNKLGSDNRPPARDKDSASKLQSPSSPFNVRRPTSPPSIPRRSSRPTTPENPPPSSRKSPVGSKQSVRGAPNNDGDDDDDVMF